MILSTLPFRHAGAYQPRCRDLEGVFGVALCGPTDGPDLPWNEHQYPVAYFLVCFSGHELLPGCSLHRLVILDQWCDMYLTVTSETTSRVVSCLGIVWDAVLHYRPQAATCKCSSPDLVNLRICRICSVFDAQVSRTGIP